MSVPNPVTALAPGAAKARRTRSILVIAGVAVVVLFLIGFVPRVLLRRTLQTEADGVRGRLPLVSTVMPRRAAAVLDVELPGSMDAILETGIWARTDGYLKQRFVDIGDRVVKGQQLADIETPEVDQQLMQTVATLNQDKANVAKAQADLALSRTTLQRYLVAGVGTVSKQQIDERTSAVTDAEKVVDAARATVDADDANMRRLLELQSFQKVYAPFDGVITVRNVDPGALISAGSTTGTRELFRLAQTDTVRIFVFVPQSYSPDIQPGGTAEVTVRERPGRVFQGRVTRTAGAIDPASRTMRAEVQVSNPDGTLLTGSYATVRFRITRPDPPLLVPQSALLVDASGVRVAVLDGDGALHYRPIELGRDYGTDAEVLSGVGPDDVLATGFAANLTDGTRVDVAKPVGTPTSAAPSAAPSPSRT